MINVFFCMSCGNSLDFEVNVWATVTADTMSGLLSVETEIDPKSRNYSIRCIVCSQSDARNLCHCTPRQLANEIVRTQYRDTVCPVQAARQAIDWFIECAPHLAPWMEDEITGQVLISADSFYRIPRRRETVDSVGIYTFFTIPPGTEAFADTEPFEGENHALRSAVG